MPNYDIPSQVKNIREKFRITQEQLSKIYNSIPPGNLQTTRSDIGKYEAGTNAIPAAKYLKFIEIFEMKQDEIDNILEKEKNSSPV